MSTIFSHYLSNQILKVLFLVKNVWFIMVCETLTITININYIIFKNNSIQLNLMFIMDYVISITELYNFNAKLNDSAFNICKC